MTEDDRKVGDGVFEVPKTLSQEHYTALVRSVLMPWGTRSPSETNDLRTAAASNLRDAFGVSKEVHSEALVAAHNANRAVVHELNAHLKDGAGVRDHGDSDDDNDLSDSIRIHAEKRAVEPIVSNLQVLPQFDATLHIALLKTEGVDQNDNTAKGNSKAKNRPSNSGGGIFACCFGGGDTGKQNSSADVGTIESGTMDGQLYFSATLVSSGVENGERTPQKQRYSSPPVPCSLSGDNSLSVCIPPMCVTGMDTASALVEFRVFCAAPVVNQKVVRNEQHLDAISDRIISQVGGTETARVMQPTADLPTATLLGVATLRVADLEDTSGMATPHTVRLLLQSPSDTPELTQKDNALPKPSAVHLAVDCFIESFVSANIDCDSRSQSGLRNRAPREQLSVSCTEIVSAVWNAWMQSGSLSSGGPLEGPLRAGLQMPSMDDGKHSSQATINNLDHSEVRAQQQLVPPQGWRGLLIAYAALHRVPRSTIALAEAMMIARSWISGPELSVVSEIHTRLATSVASIASGRAAQTERAMHAKAAAFILPHAERSLQKWLAPPPGTITKEATTIIQALAPVLALCLPLETSASKFANYIHRAARQAVMLRTLGSLKSMTRDGDVALAAMRQEDHASNASQTSFDYSHIDTTSSVSALKDVVSPQHASSGSTAPLSFSRVTFAVNVAIACFDVDMSVYKALPSGVSAAPVVFHSMAMVLMQVAKDVIVSACKLWAPPYGKPFEELDSALRQLRIKMRGAGLVSVAGPLSVRAIERLMRVPLDHMLNSLCPRLVGILEKGVARERSISLPPTPVAPARGAMHSASLVDLFAALRDAYIAAMPASVSNDARWLHHTKEVDNILAQALCWYVGEHERDCLSEVRSARARLWADLDRSHVVPRETSPADEERYDTKEDATVNVVTATLSCGFHTRLSNIHACVASLRALREDCPLLWRGHESEPAAEKHDEEADSSDSDDDESRHKDVNKATRLIFKNGTKDAGTTQVEMETFNFDILLRKLRCSRASVIAAAAELLMDVITPDLSLAVLSPDFTTRRIALAKVFDIIDAEFAIMNSSLAAGAFRLAAGSIYRALCAALERLILHRSHDDIDSYIASLSAGAYAANGGCLSGTSKPLTESQHSRVVEIADALHDFLAVDGAGVPSQVLTDGEKRLRRLLNLWFTPTVEVCREYHRQTDAVVSGGGGAVMSDQMGPLSVLRPPEGGGVGLLDLIQLLAQRTGISSDGEAAVLVDTQSSVATGVNAQALFGLEVEEYVLASFVCRLDETTLAGRFFITPTCVGFSSCGVGPDHPHDLHSALKVPISHIVRVYKGDTEHGPLPGVSIVLVDSRCIRLDCFAGGASARDRALDALRSRALER